MCGDTVSKAFKDIVQEAGIKYCTLHDLRRTFVSHLANAGVNAALVQQLAGHSAIATTVRYYTGVMPDALREAQAQLPFDDAIGIVSESYHGPREAADGRTEGKIVSLFSKTG
jgi:integrase